MLNRDQIKEILPHREPFLLVDEVDELVIGEKCVAKRNVPKDEFWVPGHFPEKAVMPGVLIVEALAQTGAIAVLSMPENKGKIAYFAKINSAKFKKQVLPGDVLTLEVAMTNMRSRSGTGVGVAKVGSEVACEVEFMFMFA